MTIILSVEEFLEKLASGQRDFKGCVFKGDFSGLDMSGLCLREADFIGATLKNVSFVGSDMSGANLSSADLEGSNFTGANLENAKKTWTILEA